MDNKTLLRIAKALEELIALVKEDMRPRKKKTQSWPTGLGKKENAKKKEKNGVLGDAWEKREKN